MPPVLMYTSVTCPFCRRAEALLAQRGVTQIEHRFIDRDPVLREEMLSRSGRRSVPQIYIGERHVGGFDDLARADREGLLATWLEQG